MSDNDSAVTCIVETLSVVIHVIYYADNFNRYAPPRH